MSRCLVSFGANIGNALETIREASSALQLALTKTSSQSAQETQYQLSRYFRTPPVGGPVGQPPFVNAVAAFETQLSVWEVWEIVRKLEHQFGRERNRRWEARKLDLDILLFDDQRVWTPQLKVPHPRMCMRRFILLPACDVAAEWIDPVSRFPLGKLASNLQTRPASLVAFLEDQAIAKPLLIEVGLQARANWVGPEDSHPATSAHDRWMAISSFFSDAIGSKLDHKHAASTNLAVFLVGSPTQENECEAMRTGQDGAWEDRHRQIAEQLRLTPASGHALKFDGPRYLLDASDPQWAIHELVAAFDAMDCPVEPF